MKDAFPTTEDFLDEMDRTIVAERRKRIFHGILFWFCAACLTGLLVYAFGHISINLVEKADSPSGLPEGSLVLARQGRGEAVGRVLRYTVGGSLYFRRGSELNEEQTKALYDALFQNTRQVSFSPRSPT